MMRPVQGSGARTRPASRALSGGAGLAGVRARVRGLARKRTWIPGLAVLALILVAAWWTFPKPAEIATIPVARGEFIIDVLTQGEIEALNSTNVSIPRGRRRMTLQIVRMVEEGAQVKAGDFLLQLDTSEAEQRVAEAENALATTQAEHDASLASIASGMAQLESQYLTEQYNFEQAQLTFKMMEYEAEIKRRETELSLRIAEISLAQAEQKIAAQKVIDQATLRKSEIRIRQAQADLEEARKTLDTLTLTAPIDGLVVYQKIWAGSEMKKVQVGDTPYPGMPVIGIPDLSKMLIKSSIPEVDISKIEAGQNVIFTVDALAGATFYASVSRIAPLARREGGTNAKVFDLEAAVDTTATGLRPGMTCECRIVTNRIEDALYVPLQAVFEKSDETIVYVKTPRSWERRRVEVGPRNRDRVVVRTGLAEGEQVCLRDPTRPLEELGTPTAPSEEAPARPAGRTNSEIVIIG
jgi:HlyD family secretion protein